MEMVILMTLATQPRILTIIGEMLKQASSPLLLQRLQTLQMQIIQCDPRYRLLRFAPAM